MLKFFGRDSGFGTNHNSAYFEPSKSEFIIIDCPNSTFQKLKKMDLSQKKEIIVLITHTHGDHIGGLGLFVQYSYFELKKPIIVVSPSQEVLEDISLLLNRIEGCQPSWYTLVTTKKLIYRKWFVSSILTKHSPQLKNKCFGYNLYIDGHNIVYTGDTSTLQPFFQHLLNNSILYVDVSLKDNNIHLKLEDILDELVALTQKNIKVYLMHLDDISLAKQIIQNIPLIRIA